MNKIYLAICLMSLSALVYGADGTKTGYGLKRNAACSEASLKLGYNQEQIGGCYCTPPEDDYSYWMCSLDYNTRSSSSRSDSNRYSNSEKYSNKSSNSYNNYGYSNGSGGRFTPLQNPQNSPYILRGSP